MGGQLFPKIDGQMTWIKERIREVELFDEEELRQAAKLKNKKGGRV